MTRSQSIDHCPRSESFLQSASNPTPANTLRSGFTVTQGLFLVLSSSSGCISLDEDPRRGHVRTLPTRLRGHRCRVRVSVNGLENVEPYTGQPGIINASASRQRSRPTPARPRGGPHLLPARRRLALILVRTRCERAQPALRDSRPGPRLQSQFYDWSVHRGLRRPGRSRSGSATA